MCYISVVSPVYQAEEIVEILIDRIVEELEKLTDDYEVILVEDCSRDKSWDIIRRKCKLNPKVKGIRFSRNFGQHYAIAAGLHHSKGEMVIVMDCDLQDNPKYFSDFIKKANEGFDIVYSVTQIRNHSFSKNIIARAFHRLFNWLSDSSITGGTNKQIGSFSLITRKVADAYGQMNDYYRPYLVMLKWLGFTSGFTDVQHERRLAGKSSYTSLKLISHAINGIISQTDKLLWISIYFGFTFAGIGFISIIYLTYLYFSEGFMEGWTSLVVLVVFNTGILLISLGVIGAYISKIFIQIKERPLYLIDKMENFNH